MGKGREHVIAWLALAYQSAYNRVRQSGQVLFLCGAQGVGKTLFSRGIVGGLMGGFGEAGSFLNGNDGFNSELFECGLWVQDDGSVGITTSAAKRIHYAETIKRVAANSTFRCNGKFLAATLTEWQGRLIATCNADSESLTQIPETGISNLDKLMLIRTADKPPVEFPPKHEIEKILERELPWLARWLLDYKIPDELKGPNRFGVKSYADPALVETSRQSSPTAGFSQILELWKDIHFKDGANGEFWEGTPLKLQMDIISCDHNFEFTMRDYNVNSIGRHLGSMVNKGAPITLICGGTNPVFRIYRQAPKTDGRSNSNGTKVEGNAKLEFPGVNLIPGVTPESFAIVPNGQVNKFQKVNSESAGDRALETTQTSTSHASCASSQ